MARAYVLVCRLQPPKIAAPQRPGIASRLNTNVRWCADFSRPFRCSAATGNRLKARHQRALVCRLQPPVSLLRSDRESPQG
ncbi:hypothetical protein TBK1r_70410 [Stieleria magnilauensis]|uniref:Transposase n=1 Tax=Stieleria magnilauensis TaxID=2527963 RepID=A0ABX5Y198_9BACT|nr:hypothetical protein TBK1r_70410 [Planctomycetes bacterium TBK1r]